jgi:hypothetical protein
MMQHSLDPHDCPDVPLVHVYLNAEFKQGLKPALEQADRRMFDMDTNLQVGLISE